MDPKPHPEWALEIEALRRMTPEQRLEKALELGRLVREFHLAGVRLRHPGLPDVEIRRIAAAERLRWASES